MKPFSASASLNPATAASSAGWLTICVMPMVYAWLVASAAALGLPASLVSSESPQPATATPSTTARTSTAASAPSLLVSRMILLSNLTDWRIVWFTTTR